MIVCPQCQSVLWATDVETVDSYETYRFPDLDASAEERAKQRIEREKRAEPYKSLPYFSVPSFQQLYDFAGRYDDDPDTAFLLRLLAWHAGNDVRRDSDDHNPLTQPEIENLQKLKSVLIQKSDADPVMFAEVCRELGHFDQVLKILDAAHLDENQSYVAEFLRELVAASDSQVCLVTKNDEREWRANRRRYRRAKAEQPPVVFSEDGPPLYEIQSKEWWVKVIGMCCHNWALIERGIGEEVTIYFFHDLGRTKNLLKNYKHCQLKGRAAIVDSLDYPNFEEAEADLKHNGFEEFECKPGPWDGYEPDGAYYDARESEDGIYSKGEYWKRIRIDFAYLFESDD